MPTKRYFFKTVTIAMPNLKDVYEVTDVIKGACNPHAIILFGSLSRGDKGNDIDLLIVTNKRDEKKVTKSLYPFYQKYPIDTFMITRKKLKELYYERQSLSTAHPERGEVGLYEKSVRHVEGLGIRGHETGQISPGRKSHKEGRQKGITDCTKYHRTNRGTR